MKNIPVVKVFFIGIVLASLLIFPFVLDYTLVPRFLGISACCCLVLYYVIRSGLTADLRIDLILLSYAAYVTFCCFSVFWANTKSESLFESSRQVLGFTVFMITSFCLKTDTGFFLRNMLKYSVVLFFIALLVAIYQLLRIEDLNRESIYLVSGLNGHKNLFASFLFLNLFFVVRACYNLEGSWKIMSWTALVLTLVLLFVLKTKAVWIGLIAAVAVFLVLYLTKFKTRLPLSRLKPLYFSVVALILTNLFFFFLLQPLIQKSIGYTSGINSTPGISAAYTVKLEEERLVLWDKTYHLITKNPLLGVGTGNWQIHIPDATLSNLYRAEDLNFTFQRPHNDFLWILSETGAAGFNLFLLFLFSVMFFLIRALGFLPNQKLPARDLLLCLAVVTGYFTLSFFDFPKERTEHTVWINIILGMSYFYIHTYIPLENPKYFKVTRNYFSVCLLLMVLVVCIVGLRLKGEFFTRRMYNYKNSNQVSNIIDTGNSALSFAYTIDPTSVPLQWYTGNAHASLGNYAEAQKILLKALALAPYNRNVLNDLGSSYVFTNNVLMAKKCYEASARISPRFDEPKLNLAAIYINATDYKTADIWLKSILHDSERRSNYQRIVDLQLNSGNQ